MQHAVVRRRMVPASLLGCVLAAAAALSPGIAMAQPATGCVLSIEPMGSNTGAVMVNAGGCDGAIAVIAKTGGNQKQFPVGRGPDIYQPFSATPCDLGVTGDKAVTVTYTAVVLDGANKGKMSAPYSGTVEAPPPPGDNPPGVSMSGRPSPGTYVRPGDTITLSVHASDDIGLTGIKILDPAGKMMFEQRVTPAPPAASGCHVRPPGQSETIDVPTSYTVPENPPTPSIRFTAIARDTAGQETKGFAEYWTETAWTGRMTLEGTARAGDTCKTTWRIELSVKVSPSEEVSGNAEARHTPITGCRFSGVEEQLDTFAISGTTDGKTFRLFFKPTGGIGIAWGLGGLHLLALPSPLPVDVIRTNEESAEGRLSRDNAGPIEGKGASASISGTIFMTCCSSGFDTEPARRMPTFLGQDDK